MSTKARLLVLLRRDHRKVRKFALEMRKRVLRAAFRSCVDRTPTSTEAGKPDLTRFPVQPPRERGTGCALALALAMHAVLVGFLFSGVHWPKSTPAGVQVDVADRSTSFPPSSQVPSVTKVDTRSTTRDEGTHANIALQPATHRHRQAVRQAHLAKLPRQVPRVRTLVARMEEKAAQLAHVATNQDYKDRLAALQALATDQSSGDNLKRDGSATASPGYEDRVRRRVSMHLVAPIGIDGNPSAVIAVRCAPDGAVLDATIRRSSGNLEWDIAALTAVDKTDPMPRDENGNAPASFLITFRPKG
ncbi:energy transducer TonB [Burkholderia contaminans]|uniref:energy transducer TonB n=1 Tax=Burkholderia contaminans TaxID=488447 RepID=UPI001F14604B|nr:energy transducer TonB [Burkholderia contaminans]UMY33411.1 TonB C-terminal domain-containing protein [Burkholderia contaminans]